MRRELNPAMIGSVMLHVSIAVALMISWRMSRDLQVGSVVPVNIVSSAPSADIRPAVAAPEPETAATEEPVPEAPLEAAPPAPQPTPTPAPPTPKPAAQPTPKAAPPTPKPPTKAAAEPKAVKPATRPADTSDSFFASLEASLAKSVRSANRPSSAPKGPARAETAPVARQTVGTGISAAALTGLTDELQRRWNPNCDVEGGRDVQVRVSFILGAGGQVVGEVASQIRTARTAVSQAAADRAVRAVYAAAPFRNLPREFYGDRIAVNFNAREACS